MSYNDEQEKIIPANSEKGTKTDPFLDLGKSSGSWAKLLQPILIGSWKHRWKILSINFLICIVFFGILWFSPNHYRAVAKILPSSDAGNLGQYANLASMIGIPIPSASDNQLVLSDIVFSERILGRLYEQKWKFSKSDSLIALKDLFEIQPVNVSDYPEEEIKKLFYKHIREKIVTVDLDKKTNVATITAIIPDDPVLAMEIVNTIINEVDKYNNSFRKTKSMEEKTFLEKRIPEIELQLKNAEEDLKEFELRERNWELSPELKLRHGRLARQVQIGNNLWTELTIQYESAKLNVLREKMTLDVLDFATVPAIKEKPKRVLLTLIFGIISGLVLVLYFSYKERIIDVIISFKSEIEKNK